MLHYWIEKLLQIFFGLCLDINHTMSTQKRLIHLPPLHNTPHTDSPLHPSTLSSAATNTTTTTTTSLSGAQSPRVHQQENLENLYSPSAAFCGTVCAFAG